MNITLPREQQEWLEAQVKAGAYESVDEALASIVGEFMHLDLNDLDWAIPLVEEGRVALEKDGGLTIEEHRSRVAAKLESLRQR
jgi:antitoxin ParD1/3/4